MKRRRRIIPYSVSVFSLLIGLVTAGLWMREYTLLWQRPLPPLPPYPAGFHNIYVFNGVLSSRDVWNSGLLVEQHEHWQVPLYWIAIASAVGAYPLVRKIVMWPWRVRHVPGICNKCRYDLTGNTSGTCPECGTKIVTSAE